MLRLKHMIRGLLLVAIGSQVFWPSNVSAADELSVTLFVVPEREICGGATPFSRCWEVDESNIEEFLALLRSKDRNPVEFRLPPSEVDLTVTEARQTKLISLVAYSKRRQSNPSTELRAAVFFLNLPIGRTSSVEFARIGGVGSNRQSTTVTKGRYVTWVNAADIDPRVQAQFELKVSGRERQTFFFGS